jgi:hypothetical protein
MGSEDSPLLAILLLKSSTLGRGDFPVRVPGSLAFAGVSFTFEGLAGRFTKQVTQLPPRDLSSDVHALVSAADARFFRSFQRRELPARPRATFRGPKPITGSAKELSIWMTNVDPREVET